MPLSLIEQPLTAERDGIPGHLSSPERDQPGPAVILLHSVTGRSGYLKLEARKLAKLGYTTLVPSLYTMVGGPAVPGLEEGARLQAETPDADFIREIDRCRDYLTARKEVDPARIAVGGYCMGGRLGILYCAARPEVRAFIGYYPTIHEEEESDLRPQHPLKGAVAMRCPSIVLFGAFDRVTDIPTQQRLWAAFLENGQRLEWHFFAVGAHGFMDPDSANYNPYAGELAWPMVVEFLARELDGKVT